MLLDRILEEVGNNPDPLTVRELAVRLGVEQSALEGMLEYLERKGKLAMYRPATDSGCGDTSCAACVFGRGCPGAAKKEKR